MIFITQWSILQQESIYNETHNAHCAVLSQTMALSFQTEPELHCHIYGSQKIMSSLYIIYIIYNNLLWNVRGKKVVLLLNWHWTEMTCILVAWHKTVLFSLYVECLCGCDELQCVADISSRQRLRSSSTSALMVLPTRLSIVGDRAFPVAASRTWNSLSLHITSAPSLQTFRRRGWSSFCAAAVSRPYFLFPITAATLLSVCSFRAYRLIR